MSSAKKIINFLKNDVELPCPQTSELYLELVKFFPLQKINTKKQYELAMKVLTSTISYSNEHNDKNKDIELYITTLSDLIANYEKQNFKVEKTTPSEMLAYLIDLQGLNQSDLAKELGGQPVVSKILKGERQLNVRQIKELSKRFKVSTDLFL